HLTKLHNQVMILGVDWLRTHNPRINWKKDIVSFQDDFCKINCVEQCPALTLDYLVSCLDHENLEPTLNDYYLCQLTSEYFENNLVQSVLSCPSDLPCYPNLSCYSLSLNNVTSKSLPVLPEVYKEF